MNKRIFIILGLLVCHLTGSAQDKIERERRIGANDVPKPAVEWLNEAFDGEKAVQWYEEQSNGTISYEAKFNWKNEFYSVEFDREGQIEDIEIVQRWADLPEKVQNEMNKYFEKNYSRHRMEKIQLQYTGSADDLEDLIDDDKFEGITTRYELEYYGVSDEGKHIWEGLFDDKGQLIQKRKVILRPTDNLNY